MSQRVCAKVGGAKGKFSPAHLSQRPRDMLLLADMASPPMGRLTRTYLEKGNMRSWVCKSLLKVITPGNEFGTDSVGRCSQVQSHSILVGRDQL